MSRQDRKERRDDRQEQRDQRQDARKQRREQRHGPIEIKRAAKEHLGRTKAKHFLGTAAKVGASMAATVGIRAIADKLGGDPKSLDPGVLDKLYANAKFESFCDQLAGHGFEAAGFGCSQLVTLLAGGEMSAAFIGAPLDRPDYRPSFRAGLVAGTAGIGLGSAFGVGLSGWLCDKNEIGGEVCVRTLQAANIHGAAITVVMDRDDLGLRGLMMSYTWGVGISAVSGWGRIKVR